MKYKFYNRDNVFRKNSYGDYKIIDGKGLYYNEDSNKWVNRLNKKVIVEKYLRYEFSVFDDREILKYFGWNKVDRIGKYLYLIYKKGINRYKVAGLREVYLDKMNDEISILGFDYYNEIREKLIELNVLECKIGKIKYGKEVRIYKLNDKFYNDCLRREVWIRNSKLIKILDKRYNKKVEEDKLIEYEIECCKELDVKSSKNIDSIVNRRFNRKLNELREEENWDFIGKRRKDEIRKFYNESNVVEYKNECRRRFELFLSEIKELKNNGSVIDVFERDRFGNRLYNIINNKDKEFREVLRIDNEKLVEVDMINGYVSLLLRIFKGIENKYGKYNSEFDKKIRSLVDDKNGNDFIEMYEDICFAGLDRVDFYRYVWLKCGFGRKCRKEDRKYIKSLILNIINGKNKFFEGRLIGSRKLNINEIGKLIFGNGFECMNKLKEVDIDWKNEESYFGFEKYKNVSKILSKMEVIIMNDRLNELRKRKIKYISLFDGILVKSSKKNEVLDIMNMSYDSDFENVIRFK